MHKSYTPGVVQFPLTKDDESDETINDKKGEPKGVETPLDGQDLSRNPVHVQAPEDHGVLEPNRSQPDLCQPDEEQSRARALVEFPITQKIESSHPKEQTVQQLMDAFGPPSHRSERNGPGRLNERFWSEFLAIECIMIFERDEKQFYVYNPSNGLYESLTAQVLKLHLSDLIGEANAKWGGCHGITRLDAEKARSSIVELTRGVVEKRDFFVNRPWAIHCQNTMLGMEEGEIKPRPFSPYFRSRNQLSVTYEAAALCPTFQETLLKPAVSREDTELTQKMFGLMVLGINRPQRIFLLQGAPNTGKTTLGRLITDLIGRWNYSELRTEHLTERFETSRALGKTLLFGPDVKAHFLQSAGAHKLKSMVGGDPMDAERKNSNASFPFPGDLNVLITSNSRLLLRLEGDTGGMATAAGHY
jgi:Family of unknown function (DUF5906)